MTRWLLCFVGCSAAALAGEVRVVEVEGHPRVAAWEQTPVRLAFWNVEWFPGGHPTRAKAEHRTRQTRAASEELEAVDPDIFFGLEIRHQQALRKLVPGRAFYYCTQIPRPEDENPELPNQGLALASRITPRKCWVLDFSALPQTRSRPVRGILGAEFAVETGRLVVYAVHLKSNRGDAAGNRERRTRAMDYLRQDWERRGYDPRKDRMVIGGDFNTSPNDPQFAGEKILARVGEWGFQHAGRGLSRESAFTVAGDHRFPPNNFDHIFLSEAQVRRSEKPFPWMQVRPFVGDASDHAMVLVDLP